MFVPHQVSIMHWSRSWCSHSRLSANSAARLPLIKGATFMKGQQANPAWLVCDPPACSANIANSPNASLHSGASLTSFWQKSCWNYSRLYKSPNVALVHAACSGATLHCAHYPVSLGALPLDKSLDLAQYVTL